jgi:cyclopropane-fatty-acyl-phospholipid synthase
MIAPRSAASRRLAVSRAATVRSRVRLTVEALLARADIRIDGARPWDIRVHDERFYRRVLADADLGFGESYMEGD